MRKGTYTHMYIYIHTHTFGRNHKTKQFTHFMQYINMYSRWIKELRVKITEYYEREKCIDD